MSDVVYLLPEHNTKYDSQSAIRAMLPNFAVIGAQKAASSYLLSCLRSHPDIYMPTYEVAFFENSSYSPSDRSRLERHFDKADGQARIGFKRPDLLCHPEAAGRMKELLGDIDLIVTLRDPVRRAVSAYYHYMVSGLIRREPIEIGMPKLLDGAHDHPRSHEILEFGLYGRYLNIYSKSFDSRRIFVVDFDQIAADFPQAFSRLCEFLCVKSDISLRVTQRRRRATPYNMKRINILRFLRKWGRTTMPDGKYVVPKGGGAWAAYNKGVRAFDEFLLARLFNDTAPPLPTALQERLVEYYRVDQVRLAEWLSRSPYRDQCTESQSG